MQKLLHRKRRERLPRLLGMTQVRLQVALRLENLRVRPNQLRQLKGTSSRRRSLAPLMMRPPPRLRQPRLPLLRLLRRPLPLKPNQKRKLRRLKLNQRRRLPKRQRRSAARNAALLSIGLAVVAWDGPGVEVSPTGL